MDFYGDTFASFIDLRCELDKVLFGSVDMIGQGRPVVLREFSNTPCPACWDPVSKSTKNPLCPYCQGEAYQFTERVVTMALYAGIAPVYKPGVQGTGQYPIADYGTTDVDRASGFARYDTWPNYERYTLPSNKISDKLYELKMAIGGGVVQPLVRSAKWKMLSVNPLFGDKGRVEYFELGLEREFIT